MTAAAAIPDRLLNVDEAAELLNAKASWVRNACRSDKLPHLRVGRYLRFRRSSLVEWIAAQERGG